MELTYKEMPGYSIRSVDDLRFQILEFEKLVKNYIEVKSGSSPEGKLHHLIHDNLPQYPRYPDYPEQWSDFIKEVKELKEFRNDIVHADFDELPPVGELFQRFEKVNQTLKPFRICSADDSRFKPIQWIGDILEIEIDDNIYRLDLSDIKNLMIELDPTSRGRVHFIKGKIVESKVLDYHYEKVTYFVEGFTPFELSHDESMMLEEVLEHCLGEHVHG